MARLFNVLLAAFLFATVSGAGAGTTGCQVQLQVPFASDLVTPITHYNRAGPRLATAGALTAADITELRNQAFDVVIDVRPAKSEIIEAERERVEAMGMAYHHLPYTDEGMSDADLATLNGIMADPAHPRVLLHCKLGSRVGAVLVLHQLAIGMDLDAALAMGRAAGLKPDMEAELVERLNNAESQS